MGLRDTHGETKEQDNRLSVFSHSTNDVKEAPGREDEMSGDSRYSVSNHTIDNVKEATGKEDKASGETWHSISSHTTDDVWTIFWHETFFEFVKAVKMVWGA